MKLLIAGASGFIGKKLVLALQAQHDITVLGRDTTHLSQQFNQSVSIISWETLSQLNAENFDAIINLCGSNVAESRWNAEVKKQLINSRVRTTGALVDWTIKNNAKPHFICANAIGIYGMQDCNDPHTLDEDSPIDFKHPCDFLSEIGIRWQQALQPAIDFGMPVTITRFGVVLGKDGGALKKMATGFKLGLGSVLGDGRQIMSWVHIDDVLRAVTFLLKRPELTGVFNLTSPEPVTQAEFARVLAQSMHRPMFLKMPAFMIRLLFGEMGESLLLKGQRVLPKHLQAAGFEFQYPSIQSALNQEYSKAPASG